MAEQAEITKALHAPFNQYSHETRGSLDRCDILLSVCRYSCVLRCLAIGGNTERQHGIHRPYHSGAGEVLVKVHATTETRTDVGLLRPHPSLSRNRSFWGVVDRPI